MCLGLELLDLSITILRIHSVSVSLPFYFLLPVSVCLPVSVHVMFGCLQGSQEDFGSPGARITGDSKLSDMGAGN